MGTGFSRKRMVTRHVQVPSSAKTPRRTPSPPMRIDSDEYRRRPYSSQPSPKLRKDNTRYVQSNSALAHYGQIWEHGGKVFLYF